ncbi:MAG TPA: MraY family glycosyltransferase [Blastocatellia bacterium]|nr:MraY family glycosyltransferase [Blastocatellia bacterium]HMX28922.1 MraY family glycosyltransferase [Blastocatellia bacterium]HMY73179.1 MraY family glycosyltransferase [Blastocatellia bacterium]HMZ17913.1 MraY family glycosyltransferase [Blastocatellia bacterium]HNG29396.1 MraY family glycosyltransferase [Blastocatellia bacterium]
MRSYVTLFTLSFLTALLITPLVRRKATEWGAVAVPDNGRHIHARPTPRLGGVAVYIAFLIALLCVPFPGNMVSDIFRANLPRLLTLLAPATLIFLFGVYDDFRSAGAAQKVIVQTIAAAMVFAGGFRIENLSSPLGGVWHLPLWFSFALTVLWIIGLTNAFNLIDGIDGLTAGASVFALVSILVFSVAQENPFISQLAVVLIGAVMGFLRFNFNPATIFLGDSGSLFLGFMIAVLSLAGSQKGSTIVAIAIPLISFGLPVTEVGVSLVRRFLSGQPLLAGDRGHIHHRLLQQGFSQRQAVILLYAVCALFSLFGIMLLNPKQELAALIFFVLGVGIVFGVQRLRYAEFSELGDQIKRSVTRGRRALAVNVRVRHVSEDLSNVQTPAQLFAALEKMLATNEFDCAELEVRNDWLLPLRATQPDETSRMVWHWKRTDDSPEEVFYADQFQEAGQHWLLSVPLTDEAGNGIGKITFARNLSAQAPTVDLKHLCGDFQRELSAALVRCLGQGQLSYTSG